MEKILLITDIFPPDIGGPASFIDLLAHALIKKGCKVTIICASPAPENEDRNRPFVVRRISRFSATFRIRLLYVLFREIIRHNRILINGLERPASAVAALLNRPFILKIVGDKVWETARNASMTNLDVDSFQKEHPWLRNKMLRRLALRRQRALERATAVIVPSQYLRKMVLGWGVNENRVLLIPNGVSLEQYSSYQPRPRAYGEPLRLVFCGRLTNWKGIDTLLDALCGMTGIQVDIIGDGPEEETLMALAKKLCLEAMVTFCGRLDGGATRARLFNAHVLILDSIYEGLSHTLIEASAAGLACIASACGGNPEIIQDGKNGMLIPPSDAKALRAAITALRDDETLRFRLAKEAKSEIQKFDFRNTVNRTMEVLALKKDARHTPHQS